MRKLLKSVGVFAITIFLLLNVVSAFHAYKFTHFFDRGSTTITKPEHMIGWQKAKAILFGINYTKLPITTTPANPYQTFSVATSGGYKLEGWYIPRPNAQGTVIMFHGHGGNKSGPVKEANAFHDFGYNICMIDFRAHGNSAGNICTIGFKESADVKAAYDFVSAKGDKNIILWGVSLGAATITKAIVDYPDIKPAKVILEMSFGSLTDAVKGRLRIMHLPLQPFTALLTFWGGTEQGFWAFGHKPEEYVKSIRVPVLVQWGKLDQRVSQQETEEIFKNIPSRQKRLVIYDRSGHQSLLVNETEKWMKNVKLFLEEN